MPSTTRRSSPPPGRPATAEADVLAATQRLLAGGANFTELGVQLICREAGVARSTFYIHFRDKADLLIRLGAALTTASYGISSSWELQDGPDAFADVFLQVLGVYRTHSPVRRAVAEVAAYDETVRDFWEGELKPFRARMIAVLQAEQQAGRVPAALDPISATRIVVDGGERAIVDHLERADPDQDAAFARELALTWWHGVYRRPA